MHFGAHDGPVIGEFDIKVVPLSQVRLFIHLLEIRTSAGFSCPNKWTISNAEQLISYINAIWASSGIDFDLRGLKSYSVIGKNLGAITDEYDNTTGNCIKSEHYQLWKNNNRKDCINLYCANELTDEYFDASGNVVRTENNTMGFATSRALSGPTGYMGVCIKYNNDLLSLAQTVAHELGHILKLTSHPNGHSDDDGSNTPFRHDTWSRSRLMAKYKYYNDNSPHREWQDPGYGKTGHLMAAGSFITIKNKPNDDTDDEQSIARAAQLNPY
jgi:hypothetical protein